MAQNNTLKETIRSAIRQNENNEITGALLQQVLLSMVNSLGVGCLYMGMATPTTNPGTPDQNVFYFATEAGTYSNFGGIVLSGQEFAVLYWDGEWHLDIVPIAGPFTFGAGAFSAQLAGLGAEASGDASVAEGKLTHAQGDYSHAEGENTKAMSQGAHSEGALSIAQGDCSHAEGYGTKAMAYGAHAEGDETNATGDYSHAEGENTKAYGEYSHAEGDHSQASGIASHAEGGSQAHKNYSHSEGSSTDCHGDAGHVEGAATSVAGNYAHAEGDGGGSDEIAIVSINGNVFTLSSVDGLTTDSVLKYDEFYYRIRSINTSENTVTVDKPIVVSKWDTGTRERYGVAFGIASHVEGRHGVAFGVDSHVEGNENIADGNASHAEGYNTRTRNNNEHAEGQFNKSNPGTIHSVGIGTSESDRKNAFEIMQNGDAYLKGIGGYDGTNPTVAQTIKQVIESRESSSNKTTSISRESTDQQYPCAKAVYDFVMDKLGDIETLLAAI